MLNLYGNSSKWKQSGMIVGDTVGLSLYEKAKVVIKENVWGNCCWQAWAAKGYAPKDLFYIYRIYCLIPDKVVVPKFNASSSAAYDDYITQINAIKSYLFSAAKNGTLQQDSATWLKKLYLEKGWAFERSDLYLQKTLEFDSEAIHWETVITNELLRYVDTFRYRTGRSQFDIEFALQDFPNNYTDKLFAPTVMVSTKGDGVICKITTQDGYVFQKDYISREESLKGVLAGDFMRAYFNKDKPQTVVEDAGNRAIEPAIPSENTGYVLKGFRYTVNTYKRMFSVEDSNGKVCELSELCLKNKLKEGISINGAALTDTGGLIFPNGLNKL